MTERRLTPADACWLYSDYDKNHQTVSALLWLDREIDPDEFRSIVQERLLDQYPTFTQRIRNSRNPLLMPHWEDDPTFDLDYHLDVIELPAPGGKEELEALVSAQRSEMLDHGRPLWRFHLIQGYQGTTAIHARIQHAVADGWALVRLVMSLADEAAEAPPVEFAEKGPRRRKRDAAMETAMDAVDTAKRAAGGVAEAASRAADAVTDAVRSPATVPARLASGTDALQEVITLAPDPKRFMEFGAGVPDTLADQVAPIAEAAGTVAGSAESAIDFLNSPKPGKTILHGQVSGEKKVVWIDPIPLDPVKQAGKALGATINDMLMGAVTNALRQYLVERDALTVSDLAVSVPISLRKPDEPLPRTLGNRFGLVTVLLPVGIADPVEQVRAIKAQIDEIKASMLPVVSFGLVSAAAITTPEVERLIHKLTQDQMLGVVTNVPGPRNALTLAGANVVGACGLGGVAANMNVCFGIFSLNGEINFAVSSDTALTPDPERLLDGFVASLALLTERAGAE
jgi:diacylglycerol O-acyltransferase